MTKYFLLIPAIFFAAGMFLPLGINLPLVKETPSLYRRAELLTNSYNNLSASLPFGVGIGASTSLFKTSIFLTRDLSFFQPVHNIFVLILVEGGIVAFLSFLLFLLFYLFENHASNKYAVVLITQLAVLGSFDHYLLTMHQTLLLCFLLFAASLANRDLLAKK